MDFKDINKSFEKETIRHRLMYENAVTEALKLSSFYGKDVMFKDQKGILKPYPESYSSIAYEVRFIPYKKNGELSQNSKSLYIYAKDTVENFAEKLQKIVTLAD
jgi:hypothetical protein